MPLKYVPLDCAFMTYECNQRCNYCYLKYWSKFQKNSKVIPFDTVTKFFLELKNNGVNTIHLTGGEPLTLPYISELLLFLRQNGFCVSITTNMGLMTDALAKIIKTVHIDNIRVSLNGYKERHNSIVDVPGAFENALRWIVYFKNNGTRVFVNYVVTNRNYQDLELMDKLFTKIGVNVSFAYVLIPFIDNVEKTSLLWLNNEQIDKMLSYLKQTNRLSFQEPRMCGIAKKSVVLGSDGSIYPCSQLLTPCGNITKEKFDDIWNKSYLLEELRNVSLDQLKTDETGKYYGDNCIACNKIWSNDYFEPHQYEKILIKRIELYESSK